tara:strand:+ start:1834 stop:2073 length:240 start_codon:yes stop_codon:yes gene_type:complete
MRAKTAIHVEYEVIKAILNSKEIGMVIEREKANMVPVGDDVAEKRYANGVQSVAQFMHNMLERRLHRIPKNHPDYRGKE